ncbi:MAG: penicillin-binding transpeptidase domain-containing protein [Bacteroidota bacterium]
MEKNLAHRTIYIQITFTLLALLLVGKALHLQVLDSSMKGKAEATTIEKKTVYPARGVVYDRDTNLLIYNIPIYDLMVNYNQVSEQMDTASFCALLGITKKDFKRNLDKDWQSNNLSKDRRYSKSKAFPFISRLSVETYARLQESLYQFPGFFVQLRNVRGYPHPYGAHVLGYLREVDQEELADKNNNYALGDYKGASGIELQYDSLLRGRKGRRYLLRDNLGREVGAYLDGNADTAAVSGMNLMLSLDLELQAYAEELMRHKAGGVIAIEPESGEILAMVSAPNYDPNLLVYNRDRGQAYNQLLRDSNNIFFNRATMAEYPPGSLFKPLVSLIALNEKVTTVNRTVPCYNGYYYSGRIRPACHAHPTCTNISQAIQHSCNAYFAQVFRDIVDKDDYTNPHYGLNIFNSYLEQFGIGERLNIDFPQEKGGSFHSSSDYTKMYKNNNGNWYSPYIMSVGIGQGEVLMTTLQMANTAAIIANKGYYRTPHLAKQFMQDEKIIPIAQEYLDKQTVGIDTAHFQPVIEGMARVVTAGTARSALIPEIPICGKTGTAENPHGDDHSIFFAFAPKDKPKIAIAVYVEHGRFGGTIAAPVASLLIEKYLTNEISPKRKWREDYVNNYKSLGRP